jgi:hypothetical protein
MGQVASAPGKGLKPVGRIGLSDSDRGIGLPERKKSTYDETKKKDKPKTAAAGGGANPPKPPKKGPTGGDNKGPKDEGRRPDYKGKDTNSSMGGLSKGSRKEETKNPKPNDKQFKDSNYNRSMGGLTKSTKKKK